MGGLNIKHLKIVTTRGKRYYYFDTGQKRSGKPILIRLPDPTDRTFGTRLSAAQAVRSRRENRESLVTMAQLVHKYMGDRKFTKRAEGTQRTYGFYLSRVTSIIGKVPVVEIERPDIREFMMAGLRPTAQRMQVAVLHILFKFAMGHDLVSIDPTIGIEIDHEVEPHKPWPDNLVTMALADDEVRLPVALLFYTDQRIGDVCAMRWTNISAGAIEIVQQKRKREVSIPVHKHLQAILDETPRSLTTILHDRKGRPLKPDTLRLRLQKWASAKGFDVVPHGLRKNGVIALFEAGCTVAEVASISGQSLQMVESYWARWNAKTMAGNAMRKWENNS